MNIRINHMQLINKENDHTLAICEIILNECFRIRGVKLMKSAHGIFLSMPSFRKGDEYVSICSPITKEFGNLLKEIILEAYQEKMREYIMKRPEDLEKEKEESVNEPE